MRVFKFKFDIYELILGILVFHFISSLMGMVFLIVIKDPYFREIPLPINIGGFLLATFFSTLFSQPATAKITLQFWFLLSAVVLLLGSYGMFLINFSKNFL